MIPLCRMWCLWRERNNRSYTPKYEFGSTSELVVSDGEDGDFGMRIESFHTLC